MKRNKIFGFLIVAFAALMAGCANFGTGANQEYTGEMPVMAVIPPSTNHNGKTAQPLASSRRRKGTIFGNIDFDTLMYTKADIDLMGIGGCGCPEEEEVMGVWTNIMRGLHMGVNSWVPHEDNTHSYAIGKECRVYNWNGIGYGYKATDTSGGFGVTLGYMAHNSGGYYNTAVGAGATASGNMATAIGGMAKATESAVAFGYKSEADGEGAVAFGAQTVAKGKGTIAYGKGAQALAEGALQFGKGVNKKPHTVQFGERTVKFYENCPYFELWLDYDATDITIQASTNNFKSILYEYSSSNPRSWKDEQNHICEVYINYTTNDVNTLYRKRIFESVYQQVAGENEKTIQIIFCFDGNHDWKRAYTGWCYEDNVKLQWRFSQHTLNNEAYGWKYIYPNVWHPVLPNYTEEKIQPNTKFQRTWGNNPSPDAQMYATIKAVDDPKEYRRIMEEKIWIDPNGVIGGKFGLGGWITRGELMRKYPNVLPLIERMSTFKP